MFRNVHYAHKNLNFVCNMCVIHLTSQQLMHMQNVHLSFSHPHTFHPIATIQNNCSSSLKNPLVNWFFYFIYENSLVMFRIWNNYINTKILSFVKSGKSLCPPYKTLFMCAPHTQNKIIHLSFLMAEKNYANTKSLYLKFFPFNT
jgi:hypothetical protein